MWCLWQCQRIVHGSGGFERAVAGEELLVDTELHGPSSHECKACTETEFMHAQKNVQAMVASQGEAGCGGEDGCLQGVCATLRVVPRPAPAG